MKKKKNVLKSSHLTGILSNMWGVFGNERRCGENKTQTII